jgi:hypothetical protein
VSHGNLRTPPKCGMPSPSSRALTCEKCAFDCHHGSSSNGKLTFRHWRFTRQSNRSERPCLSLSHHLRNSTRVSCWLSAVWLEALPICKSRSTHRESRRVVGVSRERKVRSVAGGDESTTLGTHGIFQNIDSHKKVCLPGRRRRNADTTKWFDALISLANNGTIVLTTHIATLRKRMSSKARKVDSKLGKNLRIQCSKDSNPGVETPT